MSNIVKKGLKIAHKSLGLFGIVVHWTAGKYDPNTDDLEHYHFLIRGDGVIVKGKHSPETNINCKDGEYAEHALNANTGRIGVAFCAMYKFHSSANIGDFPITKEQTEAMFKLLADLSIQYKIPVGECKTHKEIDLEVNGYSNRKIDIIYLPSYPSIKPAQIGDFIRSKINWYIKNR